MQIVPHSLGRKVRGNAGLHARVDSGHCYLSEGDQTWARSRLGHFRPRIIPVVFEHQTQLILLPNILGGLSQI